jgi:hypothetical protein
MNKEELQAIEAQMDAHAAMGRGGDIDAMERLIAEVRRLRAALEVYADGANWGGHYWKDLWNAEGDGTLNGYDVARAALEGREP